MERIHLEDLDTSAKLRNTVLGRIVTIADKEVRVDYLAETGKVSA